VELQFLPSRGGGAVSNIEWTQETWNPIAGAFSRVSASVQNALFTRRPAASIAPSTEVYYGSVLAGR